MQASAGSAGRRAARRIGICGADARRPAGAADGRGHRDPDREQRDDRQRAVGHGFLGAQQRDQNDDPKNPAAASVSHIGKVGERQI